MKPLLLLLPALCLISCASVPASAPAPSYSAGASETRQIRHTGSMSMKSRSLKESSEQSIALVNSYRGILHNSKLTEDDFSATFRVPSSSLKPVMKELGQIGKVTHQRVSQDDVTAEYRDMQAELKNKIALRDRLRVLLKKATKVSDALEIEKQLAEVQTELDQLSGQLNALKTQVALSTLSLDIERNRIPGPLGLVTKGTGWFLGKLVYLEH
ncbi:DUF4349 domain-containing protein [Akkermansiaceae bacterium]|nr:DUF4349 domain-containing protein [Akkermansiaceae bacterium]